MSYEIPKYVKVLAALVTQAASSAPTTDVEFCNGIGDYTWGRENTGTYTMTFDEPVLRNNPKNWMSITNNQNVPNCSIVVEYISTTVLRITSYTATPSPGDGIISNMALEIIIYES